MTRASSVQEVSTRTFRRRRHVQLVLSDITLVKTAKLSVYRVLLASSLRGINRQVAPLALTEPTLSPDHHFVKPVAHARQSPKQ